VVYIQKVGRFYRREQNVFDARRYFIGRQNWL